MYICICKGITESDIAEAVANGAGTLSAVRKQLGVGSCCGSCVPEAKDIIKQTKHALISKETAMIAAAISYAA